LNFDAKLRLLAGCQDPLGNLRHNPLPHTLNLVFIDPHPPIPQSMSQLFVLFNPFSKLYEVNHREDAHNNGVKPNSSHIDKHIDMGANMDN
jgi:hypothetical protein